MKKTLLFLLLTLLSCTTLCAYTAKIDGIYYNFSGDEAIVTSGSPKYSGAVVIPSSVIYNSKTYSVTSIGSEAFYGCSGLTSITIPNSVTSIDRYAFEGCRGLTSITIPGSVTSIGKRAFSGCSSLTSITIPNSVTSIGEEAFRGCSGLTSVTIGNSVTSIGGGAFSGCSSLTSVTIPNSVTSIDRYAFSSCSSLTSVTIGNSVTSIGEAAFSGCSGLTSIKVETGNTKYDSRNNCNAIIETATNTLIAGCQNTIIPNSVTSIGDYAFYGCSSLTSVSIPNSVTSIGNYAFYGCSITSVTIGNGVTSIGSYAFYNCSSLTDVYCLREDVPKTSSISFNKSQINSATLHVPQKSLDLYKATSPWSDFGTIVALPSKVDGDLNNDDKTDIADAVTVLNIMAADEYDKAADVNNDGKIDIADFVTILNIMAEQ